MSPVAKATLRAIIYGEAIMYERKSGFMPCRVQKARSPLAAIGSVPKYATALAISGLFSPVRVMSTSPYEKCLHFS